MTPLAKPEGTAAQCAAPLADPAFAADAVAHLGHLRRTSLAITRDRAEAEDLVQDAYVRALSASKQFRPGTNLKAWLLTIVRNLASNRRRDRSRADAHLVADHDGRLLQDARASADSPEQALLRTSMAPRLQAALESMPKALRDAVWLRDVEELSYAEIAVQLRIPVGTVMSRISRGRRLLHDRLIESEPS